MNAQYFEIYMEKIYDLVNYSSKGIGVSGITTSRLGETCVQIPKRPINSFKDAFSILKIGQKNKKEASTFINDRSSRSHTVFAIELVLRNQKGRVKRCKLNLIDLAGSEKYNNLGECDNLHKESNNINKSLSYLSKCILSLSQKERHIPFRNSMLTRYLSDTLGGNSNTMIILTVSKLKNNLTHTKITLEFGLRAIKIKTTPVVHVEYSLPELKKIIKKLEKENGELKFKISELLHKLGSNEDVEVPDDIPDFEDIS